MCARANAEPVLFGHPHPNTRSTGATHPVRTTALNERMEGGGSPNRHQKTQKYESSASKHKQNMYDAPTTNKPTAAYTRYASLLTPRIVTTHRPTTYRVRPPTKKTLSDPPTHAHTHTHTHSNVACTYYHPNTPKTIKRRKNKYIKYGWSLDGLDGNQTPGMAR